jgi:hypothetical protein
MKKMRAAIAALLLVALAAPAALAVEGNQNFPLTWNDPEFLNSAEECEDEVATYNVGPGQVLWHFVQTQPAADSGNLTINGEVGPIASVDSPANVLHWYVVTDASFTTITSLSSDVDGGNLVLSHTCFVEQEVEGETSTPEGSIAGETDEITEPPTDTLVGSTGSPSNGAWTILLVALAGLMVSALVLTPSARRNRR